MSMVNVTIDYFGRKRVVYIREDMIPALSTVLAALSQQCTPVKIEVENNIPYYFWNVDNIDSYGYYSGELKYDSFDFSRKVPEWDKIDSAKYVSNAKSMIVSESCGPDVGKVHDMLLLRDKCADIKKKYSQPEPNDAEDYSKYSPYQILIKERARVLKDIRTDPCINPSMMGYSANESVYEKVDDTNMTVLYIYNKLYGAARLIAANSAIISILNTLGEFIVLNHFQIKGMSELDRIQLITDRIKTQIFRDESAAKSYYDLYISDASTIDAEMIREYIRDNYMEYTKHTYLHFISYNDFIKHIKKIFNIAADIDITAIVCAISYIKPDKNICKKGAITDKLLAGENIREYIKNNSFDDYRCMTEYIDSMIGYNSEPSGELYKCSKLKIEDKYNLFADLKKNKVYNILPIEIIGIDTREDKYDYPINSSDISYALPKSDSHDVFQPVYAV